ncbi:MAG: Gfo/Idh/MocA family protein [Ostreibacterium sp.]
MHYHGRFFSNYAANPMAGFSWRYRQENGFGVLTDIMSHAADMALYLAGDVDLSSIQERMATLINERPVLPEGAGHYSLGETNAPMGNVTNDDYASAQFRFKNGALGYLDTSRVFYGPTSENHFEIHGSKGSIRWNFERMNELQLFSVNNTANQGYRTIYSSPAHPGHHLFNPSNGSGLGYNDLKTLEVYYFLNRLVNGRNENTTCTVTFEDAAKVGEVLQAVVTSSV